MTRCPKGKAADIWQQRLTRYESSGLTVKQFCQQEGISRPSFYHWRKKLQKLAGASHSGRPAFQAVRITPAPAVLTIHLPTRARLEVPADQIDLACRLLQQLTQPPTPED